jgi:ATP-dependent Lon protease
VLRKIARDAVGRGLMPPRADGASPCPAPAPPAAPPSAEAAGDAAALSQDTAAPAQPAEAAPPPPSFSVTVSGRAIEGYLGKVKFLESTFSQDMKPGLAYGLAWTELGGQLLPIEVAIIAGKGELMLTGSLGDVMKESAQAALSFLRASHEKLGIPADFSRDRDIHVHVPEGAIPKDGPSAGISLMAALLSAVRGVAVKSGFAMTGEITLTGRLLPIGGVKEKVLAAHRYKMTQVLLPRQNEKDLEEIPKEVVEELTFLFADSVLDALSILFPEGSIARVESTSAAAEPPRGEPARSPSADPVSESAAADLP